MGVVSSVHSPFTQTSLVHPTDVQRSSVVVLLLEAPPLHAESKVINPSTGRREILNILNLYNFFIDSYQLQRTLVVEYHLKNFLSCQPQKVV